ncbi:hypothetical protein ACFL42_02900 [Candidatus Omnitrophota bacterium]
MDRAKNIIILFISVSALFLAGSAVSDTVHLRSGEKIKGKVVATSSKSTMVQTASGALEKYDAALIERIEIKEDDEPDTRERKAPDAPRVLKADIKSVKRVSGKAGAARKKWKAPGWMTSDVIGKHRRKSPKLTGAQADATAAPQMSKDEFNSFYREVNISSRSGKDGVLGLIDSLTGSRQGPVGFVHVLFSVLIPFILVMMIKGIALIVKPKLRKDPK